MTEAERLACIRLLEEINAEAEADMLRGNSIAGAHHRAIERKLEELRLAYPPTEDELQHGRELIAAGR